MDVKVESFENYAKLKSLCLKLIQNQNNVECIKELNATIQNSPQSFIKVVQPTVLSTFYPILKSISENKSSFTDDEKRLIVDTFKNLFEKSNVDKMVLFFNIYSFLLLEIYDHRQHIVLPIPEEYKLSIMNCVTSLMKCASSDLVFSLYTRENAPRFCQMLYAALEIAKTEQLRSLRASAMECIMAIAQVLEDKDFADVELRNQVAEVFLFFLPGIASGLTRIAVEDEKVGHKVPTVALKAWGRIVALLMTDYKPADEKFDFANIKNLINKKSIVGTEKRKKIKNEKDIKEYLHSNKRTALWYKETDKRLQPLVGEFARLAHHSHPKVRLELARMCELITENCFATMPTSTSHLIEIVITLSEDDDDEAVKRTSSDVLQKLSGRLSSINFKSLLENLEEGFYNGVNSLPRKFNGIDEREHLASLNLLIGYIQLFGEHKLSQVLLSATHLNKLMETLMHISELERGGVSLLEEHTVKVLEINPDLRTPWKNFRHFKEDSVKNKLEKLCALLAKHGGLEIISDFLLDVIIYHSENRKEAIFILNEAISGVDYVKENMQIMKNIVTTYTDSNYWQVPSSVIVDEYGCATTLADVQDNVVQVCLLVEGIGKIALAVRENFREFLLKTLYLVLERAGSGHPLVKAAGLSALTNVTFACGYSDITNLINGNIDYFAYHVERKLNKLENNESVLSVLAVVLNYGTVDVLAYIADIIEEVLVQSCDEFKERNATAFLEIFKIFVRCLRKWFGVEVKVEAFKSKAEKTREIEDFQVTGVEMEGKDDFSDDIMGKSAEEMYKEDMEKTPAEIEQEIQTEVEEYKKPEPPLHIKLTVAVLSRTLHFLPSKDKTKKLLALNILSDGLEILRDFENDLLPIVHQIWSPLVQRFKEFNEPLIVNYSFLLLVVLARLSKEFIRMRTTKEVLPSILLALDKFSAESYLKDKGSAYRYSQTYKLQLAILENLGRVLIDLDIGDDKLNETMDVVFKYLSSKQPVPLQTAAIQFFKTVLLYDPDPVKSKLESWQKGNMELEYESNISTIFNEINIAS